MPLPKYKTAKSNTRERRAAWLNSLQTPTIHTCPSCNRAKQVHRACAYCGFYTAKRTAPAMKRTQG
ncbi:MAG: 50S ribosomal protein L32 [bacterium]